MGLKKEYKTAQDLQEAVDGYFKACDDGKMVLVKGERMKVSLPYTVEGLAEHLGTNRMDLLRNEKYEGYPEEFGEIITRAKNKILRNKVEMGLMGLTNPALTIFDLKNNYDYKDKKEVDHTSGGVGLGTVDVTKLSDETLKEIDGQIQEQKKLTE